MFTESSGPWSDCVEGLVESFCIELPNDDPNARPAMNSQCESNVPGMYVFGALGGYPIIKQTMSHGYQVDKVLEMMPSRIPVFEYIRARATFLAR
tara:strand:- start:315 stop:599 length:285 start_codon:yes stop_codon:yes gene_type:complete